MRIIQKFNWDLNDITRDVINDKTQGFDAILIAPFQKLKQPSTLENLNDACNQDRLNKEDITPIVCNNESLFFTYDIGHEIIENGNITDLNEFMIPLISNVHIHTYNSKYKDGYDHKPINQGDEHWNKCLKGIYFLKNNHYDGNIVFEYDLYQCFGDNIEEKIKSYLASIDNFSDRFN